VAWKGGQFDVHVFLKQTGSRYPIYSDFWQILGSGHHSYTCIKPEIETEF